MRTLFRRHRKAIVIGAALIALVGGSAAGCNGFTEPFKDAPRSGVDNGQPADLIRFPDGFSNAATKCDHGNRIYVAYHGENPYAAIAVVANDPTCAGK